MEVRSAGLHSQLRHVVSAITETDHASSLGAGGRAGLTDEKETVILWLCPEVLEDALGPVLLHEVPVVDQAVLERIRETVAVALCSLDRLVTDEEVEILDSSLARQVAS